MERNFLKAQRLLQRSDVFFRLTDQFPQMNILLFQLCYFGLESCFSDRAVSVQKLRDLAVYRGNTQTCGYCGDIHEERDRQANVNPLEEPGK